MLLKENNIWQLGWGVPEVSKIGRGQHRSVVLAEKTAALLREQGYNVRAYHRDIALADTSKGATK